MTGSLGVAVVVLVLAGRFLAPLAIPRYPLPAVIIALVLDAVDQTIFQQIPDLNLDGYQQYDKALDVFYLTIAYISTLRNWSDPFAFGVSRFLFYYRLVGVLVFELADSRWLLLVFPNTFEYFFIAYELVRTRWSPLRLGHRRLIWLAAGIWIVIKLPQEWWLHVAELDVTDEVKTRAFGVDAAASWSNAVGNRPWVLLIAALVVATLALLARSLAPRLPAPDWPFGMRVDERARGGAATQVPPSLRASQRTFVRGPLIEKIVLVSMVSVIFAQILPVQATTVQIVLTAAIVIVLNSVVTHWFARRGVQWSSTVVQFLAVSSINAGIVLVLVLLPGNSSASIDVPAALFFLLLLSLLVTLYDRYRMLRKLRRVDPAVILDSRTATGAVRENDPPTYA